MGRSFCILLLEDNDWDAKMVQEALEGSGETRGFRLVRARSLGEAERELERGDFDLVLCDLNVGDSRGLDTAVRMLARSKGRVPLVVLTGTVSDQLGVAAVKAGAVDFVSKDHLDTRRLALAIRFAIERDENARLEAAVARHEAECEFRNRMLNLIAHELNTPITPLAVQIYMLKSGALGALTTAQAKSMALVDRSMTRLQALVRDVVDVARINARTIDLKLVPCDVAKLVREVGETYRPMAETAGIAISVEASPAEIRADPARLAQVLFNLVSNALKYTPSGGKIGMSSQTADAAVSVKVTDSGVGLSVEQASKLFQPFSQVQPAGTQQEGVGLGLFISKGLVEAHGGTMWCESPGPGKGSTFGFDIPSIGPSRDTRQGTSAMGSPARTGHATDLRPS